MASFLDRERSIAGPGFNRWLVPPAALAIHLCIGQVYATSVYKTALVKNFDTNNTADRDRVLDRDRHARPVRRRRVAPGSSGSVRARRCSPPPASGAAGFLVGAVGIATQQLWLLYLGYGVIGGIGLGIGYISPVSTLIKWFPDRPGSGDRPRDHGLRRRCADRDARCPSS